MQRHKSYGTFAIFFLIFTASCHPTDTDVPIKTSDQTTAQQKIAKIQKRNIQSGSVRNTESPDYESGHPNGALTLHDLIVKSLRVPEIHGSEGVFYSKWRQPGTDQVEFINNINIRANEDLAPTWPSRGRRSEHNSSRSRREEDGELFWGNRGRRSEDPDVFWGVRGKKNDDEQFWGVRGKKNDDEQFWGVRGKKNDDEQFWGVRGKKNDEDPFWGNRGKKDDFDPFWSSRGKKEDPFWGVRGKRNKLRKEFENLLKSYDLRNLQKFVNNRGISSLEHSPDYVHVKETPERRSEGDLFWGARGKKDEFDPFWGNRGKKFDPEISYEMKKSEEDPFWGNRGKRNSYANTNAEKKNEDELFWGTRGKRPIPFIDEIPFEMERKINYGKMERPFCNKHFIPTEADNILIKYILKSKNRFLKHMINNAIQRNLQNKMYLKTIIDNGYLSPGERAINLMPQNITGNKLITPDERMNSRDPEEEDDEEYIIYRGDSREPSPIVHRTKRDLGTLVRGIDNQDNVINKDSADTIVKIRENNVDKDREEKTKDNILRLLRDGSYINVEDGPIIRFTPNDKFEMDLSKVDDLTDNNANKQSDIDKTINAHQVALNDVLKMLNK